ncbi:MAG: 50S ribosomal protein L25 [Bacteroidales bacterium]
MKEVEIKGKLRQQTGKKDAARLRKQGFVPCVMYGGKENIHFCAPTGDFKKIIYSSHIYLVNLDLEGNHYQGLIKDIQFHPVTDEILHIDFIEALPGKDVIVNTPIHLVGDSVGIKAGGKLRQRRRYLKVKGKAEKMPEYLEIDITDLDVGKKIKVGDLSFEDLELLDTPRALVVQVISSRLAAKGMIITEEAGEAPAEEESVAAEEAATEETGEESTEA